ncbi:sodium/bile acid cotransporter 5-like [Contarinia nasturtii]|uniref:sodium/bile acid cotransporter 5-like n=1 Tax=Contarinia nasturtii TaxID=265458 RepID=UPI0012D472C6|nr:sodium/bile acid cotransporter 5-like [Contarinia nasturtii]
MNFKSVSILYFLPILLLTSNCSTYTKNEKNESIWKVNSENMTYSMYMGESKNISVTLTHLNRTELMESKASIMIISDSNILKVSRTVPLNEIDLDEWSGVFSADAIFIGSANVFVMISRRENIGLKIEESSQRIRINISCKSMLGEMFMQYFDKCVLIFYFIMYVNFGILLELSKVKDTVRKPLKPCVAFICNFIFTPMASYLLGMILFPPGSDMRFGLFVCGLSLLGGGMIFWTVVFGGNIDLSFTQSILNILFAAGVVIPLWIFTFGRIVFGSTYLNASYISFLWNIVYLLIPLSIGVIIQYCYKPSVKFATKSIIWLINIYVVVYIVYLILCYWSMFNPDLLPFTGRYFLSAFLLPLLAYSFGWLIAFLLRDEYTDRLQLATAALTKNMTIVTSIMYITVYFPQTDTYVFLSSLVIIMIPIPVITHQLIDIMRARVLNNRTPLNFERNEPKKNKNFDDLQQLHSLEETEN